MDDKNTEIAMNFGIALQLWKAHISEIKTDSVQIAWDKSKCRVWIDAKYFVQFTSDPLQCAIKKSGLKHVADSIEAFNNCIDMVLSKNYFGNNRTMLSISPDVFYDKQYRR